ncbi:hypothetical protein V8C44DRAFT_353091 [Trichoderma aethiopicum]
MENKSRKRSPSLEKMAAPCSRPVSSGRRSSACRPCPLSDATHSRTTQTVGWAQTRKKYTNTRATKLRMGSDVKGGRDAPKLPFRRLDLPWPNFESNCCPFPLGIPS